MLHDDPAARAPVLQRAVARYFQESAISVQPWRSGVDYDAYLVSSRRWARAVLRVPHIERTITSYDESVDFATIMEKEVLVHGLLTEAGVPCPAVIGWDTSHAEVEWSWMLVSYVEHEPVESLGASALVELGRIARRIHAIETVDARLQVPGETWTSFIATRIEQRLAS
ncbi:MAG: phosphotransferase, partial [Dehalococcoidia bacterium]